MSESENTFWKDLWLRLGFFLANPMRFITFGHYKFVILCPGFFLFKFSSPTNMTPSGFLWKTFRCVQFCKHNSKTVHVNLTSWSEDGDFPHDVIPHKQLSAGLPVTIVAVFISSVQYIMFYQSYYFNCN